jgi:branched-chain amino acid transport system permease protein
MSALVYSAMITILSLGFSLTYLTAKIPNFAHGTYAGVGIYISYTFSKLMGFSPYYGFPLAFIGGGLIGVLLYKLVVGTLRKMGGGEIVLTISTIAIGIFLKAGLDILAFWIRATYGTFAYAFLLKLFDFQIAGYQGIFPVSIVICVIVVIALFMMLTRTNIGVAMRATTEDPALAQVLGINTDRIQMFSWFLTGALACLSGAMIPLWFQSGPDTGNRLLISTMAGSLLGGLDNIYGAIVGGFFVGCIEILLTTFLQGQFGMWVGEYRPLIPMMVVIGVLLVQPTGISGTIENWLIQRKTRERLRMEEAEAKRQRTITEEQS